MSWICPKCETENPSKVKVCEVCDSPREYSPVDILKEKLKEKYSDSAYRYFIQYHSDILEAADKGNTEAQFQVGEWFLNRKTVTDREKYDLVATWWLLKAAGKGHTEAQIRLASCYEEGRGCSLNNAEAMKWFKEAARKGNKVALRKYLKLKYNTKTYESLLKFRFELLATADKGNRNSQCQLGDWFRNNRNLSSFRKEAVFWYTKAANNGHRDAMWKLGECYENGIGVYSNYYEAIKWYEKAANIGDKLSCLKLAHIYLYGIQVRRDVQEAITWFKRAGKSINASDCFEIGKAYFNGDDVFKNVSMAIDYFRSAAENGYAAAQYKLGVCYENGTGVTKDMNNAKYWYEQAAMQGHKQASECINRINKESEKKQMTFRIIFTLLVGPLGGSFLYVETTENITKWGTNVADLWTNVYPLNLIACLLIGTIVAWLCCKD